jgi:hypothetical protein
MDLHASLAITGFGWSTYFWDSGGRGGIPSPWSSGGILDAVPSLEGKFAAANYILR